MDRTTIFEFQNLQESSEGPHCLLFWAKYAVFRKYIYNFALSKHFVDHLDTNTLTTKERMGKKVKRKERERGRERERERESEREREREKEIVDRGTKAYLRITQFTRRNIVK